MITEARMGHVDLTDPFLRKKVRSEEGRRLIFTDREVKGFELRVAPLQVTPEGKRVEGARSFCVYYRIAGHPKKHRHTIGEYPAVGLAEARDLARAAKRAAAEGRDPNAEKKAAIVERAETRANTFEKAAEDFITNRLKGLRSADAAASAIRRHLISRWKDRPASEITKGDVVALLRELQKKEQLYLGRLLLAYCKTLFGWLMEQPDYKVTASPCQDLKAKKFFGKNAFKPRRKRLTEDMMRRVWTAAVEEGYPFGDLTRMLLLSGVRRTEAAKAHGSEFNYADRLWTLPPHRTKGQNPPPHEVPYPAAVRTLLDGLPEKVRKRNQFLFSTDDGKKPVSGYGKGKDRLDVRIARAFEAEAITRSDELLQVSRKSGKIVVTTEGHAPFQPTDKFRVIGIRHGEKWGYIRVTKVVSDKKVEGRTLRALGGAGLSDTWFFSVPEWRNHDLRKTMRSGLSASGVPDMIAELCVAHVPDELHQTYDFHDYRAEKKSALEKWAQRLLDTVDPNRKPEADDNVVTLPTRTATAPAAP